MLQILCFCALMCFASHIHQPVVNPDARILKVLLIESCPFLSKTCRVRFCLSKSLLSIMGLYLQGVYYMIMKNFQRHYNTNRAPFGLSYHPAWSVLSISSPLSEIFLFSILCVNTRKGWNLVVTPRSKCGVNFVVENTALESLSFAKTFLLLATGKGH